MRIFATVFGTTTTAAAGKNLCNKNDNSLRSYYTYEIHNLIVYNKYNDNAGKMKIFAGASFSSVLFDDVIESWRRVTGKVSAAWRGTETENEIKVVLTMLPSV